MSDSTSCIPTGCVNCKDLPPLPFSFTMAFQPIVDVVKREVFAYEALVRGLNGEGAYDILSKVTESNRYQFDQQCRVRAIELASRLGMTNFLSINFLPNAVYQPAACIRSTLEAARANNFPCEKIIFEVTESEPIRDPDHLSNIFIEYRSHGFTTAIDDFGAGHAGLNLLADFQPHIIKLDMALIRGLDSNRVRKSIVQGVVSTAMDLEIQIIGEGVETHAELETLRAMGVTLFQGYLFARPEIEKLPEINFADFC